MFQVEKRDGTIAEFQMKKITDAIGKALVQKICSSVMTCFRCWHYA